MGTVYLGEHTTIRKKFAIKVLSHEFAHKPDLVERFLQEARAASMISQENVVEITDFGDTPDGSVFFVMEHLQGEDLSDTVKDLGALPWSRVKPIMIQVCRALEAAHEAGIIHRDMKPENCYRIKRGKNDDFIKVLDFGIAKVTSEEGEGGKGLTRTGMIFGTPEYMSPEQAQGAKVDTRVDIYATGVIMYELLTGRVPFTADTFMGILTKHMFEVPEAPSAVAPNANIPPEVESLILKAMQKDREYRFQDMKEMIEAIEAVGTGAAGVEVVSENIVRPATGEMAFVGGSATVAGVAPGTAPPLMEGGYAEPPKSKSGLIFGVVGGLGLVIAGVGAFLMLTQEDDPVAIEDTEKPTEEIKEAPKEEVAKPEPVVAAPPEPEKMVQLAPKTPKVVLHIKTKGIDAKILDARDMGMYGTTNTEEGITVEKSKDKLDLILRADGYEDLPFSINPNRDKVFEPDLKKIKKKKSTGKKSGGKTPAASKDPKPEPKKEPRPTKGPRPGSKKDPGTKKGGMNSPDLKDPFARRKGG
jgi:serine/threonine-protein kinase